MRRSGAGVTEAGTIPGRTDDTKRGRGGNGVRKNGTRKQKLKRELGKDTERGRDGTGHGKKKDEAGRGKKKGRKGE